MCGARDGRAEGEGRRREAKYEVRRDIVEGKVKSRTPWSIRYIGVRTKTSRTT